jgi:arginyl-tRNA synthetase
LERAGLPVNLISLEIPPDQDMGDIALPCFSLAKQEKKSPVSIASSLAERLKPEGIIDKITSAGPYVNFHLNKAMVASQVIQALSAPATAGNEGLVMVEFSSPNTNKPLHLGHLRNIALGTSISRIIEHDGRKVIRACLVNDRGIHICKSMLAYMSHGQGRDPDKKGDHFVGDYYVMFSRQATPELEAQAQELLRKWETGDKEVREVWQKMNSWALAGFAETYKAIGAAFDKVYYESEIFDKAKQVVTEGMEKGAFIEKEGAITAPLDDMGLPDKVVMRKDGTSLYITQDIYLAMQKFNDFPLESSIYVVGSEQNLHFRQLFAVLAKLGFPHAASCRHLSYGMVNLPDGRMKSR